MVVLGLHLGVGDEGPNMQAIAHEKSRRNGIFGAQSFQMFLESQAAIVHLVEVLEHLARLLTPIVYQKQQETVEVHEMYLFAIDLHLALDNGLKMQAFHESLARNQLLHHFVYLVVCYDISVQIT